MNNKKTIIIVLFIALVLVQIYVPISMIVQRETTLRDGTEYKFRTAPVDPYDAFRGRYVSINIEDNSFNVPDNAGYERNGTVYVLLEKDADGFTKMTSVAKELPKNGTYFKTKVLYVDMSVQGGTTNSLRVKIPFDRYYMSEKLAPVAEKAYNENSRNPERDAYVTVKIKSGFAVLERLYLKGIPIEEYIKKNITPTTK